MPRSRVLVWSRCGLGSPEHAPWSGAGGSESSEPRERGARRDKERGPRILSVRSVTPALLRRAKMTATRSRLRSVKLGTLALGVALAVGVGDATAASFT